MSQTPRVKNLAGAAFFGFIGVSMLFGATTLGGWSETRNIVQTPTTITTGEPTYEP
ncbi:hypothetical protein [Paeniglutamicibacter sp.]|uniref:hypothetical protein n=1 Tax=Paeniglutamicibacter sp. TaxID=1934391 RepID=UPI003988E1F7